MKTSHQAAEAAPYCRGDCHGDPDAAAALRALYQPLSAARRDLRRAIRESPRGSERQAFARRTLAALDRTGRGYVPLGQLVRLFSRADPAALRAEIATDREWWSRPTPASNCINGMQS